MIRGTVLNYPTQAKGALEWATTLFDGYGFNQVARAVDIHSALHGDVIGQHLQRNDFENRRKQLRRFGNGDDMMHCIRDFGVTFGGNRNYASAGFFHLAQVADGLLSAQHGLRIAQIARGDTDDGNVFVDERVRDHV